MIVAAVILVGPLVVLGGVYVLSEAELRDVAKDPPFDHAIPTDSASVERGRHIARTRGCFGCHGQELQGKDFGEQWDWPERAVAPNLAAYARKYDAATLEAAIRQGIGADGRALTSMPSFNFARLSDEDTAALIAFLRSAPVVEGELPDPKLGWSVRWTFAIGAETHMAEWADRVPPLRVDADAEPQRARGEYLAMTMCNECHGRAEYSGGCRFQSGGEGRITRRRCRLALAGRATRIRLPCGQSSNPDWLVRGFESRDQWPSYAKATDGTPSPKRRREADPSRGLPPEAEGEGWRRGRVTLQTNSLKRLKNGMTTWSAMFPSSGGGEP